MFGVGFLRLWEAAVKVFDFKPYFLPPPSAISAEFIDNFGADLGADEGVGR